MAVVSHKLKSAFEGALVGGGDPASSPLYVFGPFLTLIVGAGVASVTFGTSVWLAVLTVVAVAIMYRLVMRWVIDGSGGSGLCEEEFGTWAIKINAGITLIEYTLTFLVSIAALVTFVSDRFVFIGQFHLVFSLRTWIAVIVTLLVGLSVNFGPKASARIFGPATLGVLLLLWAMIFATIWKQGLHFPSVHLAAFHLKNIHYTLGGYARILALMTGIEVFANLVSAYHGPAKERSKKAFGSLLIIMGTTSLTMLIVGPAILHYANPLNTQVSVFTQTMDALLPKPIAYIGTFLGVMVLLSAAAASMHGIQNLVIGLRYRHYVPSWFGSVNRFDVAGYAVWSIVGVCVTLLIVFGTHEHTYLSLYAAGVFILLSLTSWACVKRLYMQVKQEALSQNTIQFVTILIAAILTTLATVIIFEERFLSGAWLYLVLTPVLYLFFGYFRRKLGQPKTVSDRITGAISSSVLPGIDGAYFYHEGIQFKNILVPLDQSPIAELSISCAQTIARNYAGTIHFMTVLSKDDQEKSEQLGRHVSISQEESAKHYLDDVKADLLESGYRINACVKVGNPAEEITKASLQNIDLVIMTTHGRGLMRRWVASTTTTDVIYETTPPLIVLRPTDTWRSTRTRFKHLLVTLDGSQISEQIIPYVKEIASKFSSHVTLLSVPEGSDTDAYVSEMKSYLKKIAKRFNKQGIAVDTHVVGSDPYQTILQMSVSLSTDLIMVVTHGRGGIKRQDSVRIGSVTEKLLQQSECPLFVVSAK